jgi:hypothetical protein
MIEPSGASRRFDTLSQSGIERGDICNIPFHHLACSVDRRAAHVQM